MLLTNPAAQSLVNITLAEKELERFTQVTWFHNSDVTGNFKASRKLNDVSLQSYCPNLLTRNFGEREFKCFLKVTRSFKYDIIRSPQVSLNISVSLRDRLVQVWWLELLLRKS